ncbi:MAG: ATP-dependent sacrificial sulfur transferase LarE [Clostridiales Family XIII bacterium]|jgi:uncharacterized protein|nr:ATP-dependent sacrificial sulfur transferase LarE [Clostridiales Family XIII bacterium]
MSEHYENRDLAASVGETLAAKYDELKGIIEGYGSLAVAFSGGVDSTFLLHAAQDALGDNVIAITARSCSFPERELREAEAYCAERGVRHFVTDSEELAIEGFAQNPPNRCYMCKTELFTKIGEIAKAEGIAYSAEGSNLDDEGDYRPGLQAVSELGVKSPLREAGLYKNDIRSLSKAFGLPTWDKQSFACLSSRFAYGETINEEKLRRVDRAEQLLLDLGFTQVRVRVHGENGEQARIEIDPAGFAKIMDEDVRARVLAGFTAIGFIYISLDLAGYRTGSMNAML